MVVPLQSSLVVQSTDPFYKGIPQFQISNSYHVWFFDVTWTLELKQYLESLILFGLSTCQNKNYQNNLRTKYCESEDARPSTWPERWKCWCRNGPTTGLSWGSPTYGGGGSFGIGILAFELRLEYGCVKGVRCAKPQINLPFLLLRQRQDCVEAGSESSFFAKAISCENGVQ